MGIVKKVRNAMVPFENEEHWREFLDRVDEDAPNEEQERIIDELDRKYRPACWQDNQ